MTIEKNEISKENGIGIAAAADPLVSSRDQVHFSTVHHAPQDYQSLLMHQEAVRLILAEPVLIEKALATLRRWDEHVGARSKPLRDEWVQILESKDWSRALQKSEHGNQLRQASPMATLLPNAIRLEIIRTVKILIEDGNAKA